MPRIRKELNRLFLAGYRSEIKDFRWALVLLIGAAAALVACGDTDIKSLPDQLSGVVVDSKTGLGIEGVDLYVYLGHIERSPFIGPEGTVRQRPTETVVVNSNLRGRFVVDFKDVKSKYSPGGLPIIGIGLRKIGYRSRTVNVPITDLVFKLEPESKSVD